MRVLVMGGGEGGRGDVLQGKYLLGFKERHNAVVSTNRKGMYRCVSQKCTAHRSGNNSFATASAVEGMVRRS